MIKAKQDDLQKALYAVSQKIYSSANGGANGQNANGAANGPGAGQEQGEKSTADGSGGRGNDGVVDVDEFHAEAAGADGHAGLHGLDLRLLEQLVLLQLDFIATSVVIKASPNKRIAKKRSTRSAIEASFLNDISRPRILKNLEKKISGTTSLSSFMTLNRNHKKSITTASTKRRINAFAEKGAAMNLSKRIISCAFDILNFHT